MQSELVKLKDAFSKIELTKTQRERAEELYTNICKFLQEKTGLDIEFYSQGSFATRTVVRPYIDGTDRLYDVDVICKINDSDENLSPNKLMNIFDNAFKDSRYSKNYKRWDKCFTVTYKETDIDEFSIDIIPAINVSGSIIGEIHQNTERTDLVDTSVAIPNDTGENSEWIYNNPKGYVRWFDEKTINFENQFRIALESTYKASIEELPDDHATNMLKNTIKLLKRFRDIYFSRAESKNKPASIVITTLVAKLSSKFTSYKFNNELEILRVVINELSQLKTFKRDIDVRSSLDKGYNIGEIISKQDGKWELKNPASGLDNILSSWNDSSKVSVDFFEWIDYMQKIITKLSNKSEFTVGERTQLYSALNIGLPEETPVIFEVDENRARPWRF